MAIVQDKQVQKKQKPRLMNNLFSWEDLDKWSFIAVIGLLIFSIVFVYSASVYDSINTANPGSPYGVALRQMMFAVLGIGVYLATLKIPIKLYRQMIIPIVGLILFLMPIPLLFEARNGAHRWIPLGPFTIQPAELAKLAIILIWSYALSVKAPTFWARWEYLSKRNASLERKAKAIWRSWGTTIVLTGVSIILYRLQSDNGSLVISLGLIVFLMMASGTFPRKFEKAMYVLAGVALLILAGAYIFLSSLPQETLLKYGDITSPDFNYVIGRFVSWVNPFITYSGAGYQLSNSLIAIANGGFFGRGIGNGLQKQGFLSEGHNDFIIANVVEEIGIFGASVIYFLYVTLISRGYKIARDARNSFNVLVAFGITTLFFFQAFWNSGGIIGLLPLKGLTAPLLSYGGTSLIIMMFALGIVQRVHIENQRRKNKQTKGDKSSL